MPWIDNASVSDSKKRCEDGSVEYRLTRYQAQPDCNTRDCLNPVELRLFATVQPVSESKEIQMSLRDEFGESVHGMIIAHYFPQSPSHRTQIAEGIYVQSSGSKFTINGYSAQNSCADKLSYQGQVWRAINTSCIQGPCGSCIDYGWVCRAVFCLDTCDTLDTPSDQIEDWVYAP